jgi:hypothetical protein
MTTGEGAASTPRPSVSPSEGNPVGFPLSLRSPDSPFLGFAPGQAGPPVSV